MFSPLRQIVERWSDDFTTACREPRVARIFFRLLTIFTAVKTVALWSVTTSLVQYHTPGLSKRLLAKVILAPAFFAYQHPNVFITAILASLVLIFWLGPRYYTTVLFFLITLNLYATNLPITNGSDIVLVMFSLWCIPMVPAPLSNENTAILKRIAFNLGVLFCQIQIVCLYFISGWDKIWNVNWRTGEALIYIQHLEILYNPILPSWLISPAANAFFAWATILFELTFVALIWKEKTRLIMILIGTVFHIFIWIVLSLPDFAGIMILSYVIFLKDKDLQRIPLLRPKQVPL